MCRTVKCRQCSKITWAGCGMHVDEVMAGVPSSARCPGHRDEQEPSGIRLWTRLLRR
ncbi:MAG: hypothetical protein ABIN79_11270 [Marmoricola sp.]